MDVICFFHIPLENICSIEPLITENVSIAEVSIVKGTWLHLNQIHAFRAKVRAWVDGHSLVNHRR